MDSSRLNPSLVVSLIALVMASAGTGYAALGDGRGAVGAGNARGEPVEIQVRNRSRGETGLISSGDGYSLRLSNTGAGGGAVYGCRAPDAPPADNLACLYADNLRGGKAFLFRSQQGPTVGHFDLGNPAGPPFTTNATGLVQNLNADKVDGLDASQLQGAQGPAGAAGPTGPQGPAGSDAQFAGAAAGGDLTGTYPNPSIASGAVTTSSLATLPAARARRETALTVADGAQTVVPLDGETFDTAGLHDNTITPSRLTAPVDGIYAIGASVGWNPSTAGDRGALIRRNGGGAIASDQRTALTGAAAAPLQSLFTIMRLDAGDFIELSVFQTSGGNLDLLIAGDQAPHLEMAWIGPAQ